MSLLDRDNVNIWQDIELRVVPHPFYTLCKILKINKNSISKTPLNTETPFKWVLVYIIQSVSFKSSTKDSNFAKYLIIVDSYPKIPKFME